MPVICRLLLCLVTFLATVVAEDFPLGPAGDIAHWVSSGRQTVPMPAPEGRDPKTLLALPPPAGLLEAFAQPIIPALPDGSQPRLLSLGEAPCASDYLFHRQRVRAELVVAVDLVVTRPGRREFLAWTDRGAVEVWLGGKSVLTAINRGRLVEGFPWSADLTPGVHRLVLRRVRLGERDTPMQVGVRCRTGAEGLRVRLPVAPEQQAPAVAMQTWLAGLEGRPDGSVVAPAPPEFPVTVTSAPAIMPWRPTQPRRSFPWPAGAKVLEAQHLDPGTLAVRVVVGDPAAGPQRSFDWPYRAQVATGTGQDLAAHRQRLQEGLATAGVDWALFAGLQALWYLDQGEDPAGGKVAERIERLITTIDNRDGTSDFQMHGALRLLGAAGDRLTADHRARILRVLTDVPYASDERDIRTMTFTSENHQIMFMVAARLAAVLMPDATFAASGRTAAEQQQVYGERLAGWFAVRERAGFHEFLSPSYMNETFLALLNLYDYEPDQTLRDQARRYLDLIVTQAADYGLHGHPLGPNGRCYRHEMLAPHREGRSAILSWFHPAAVLSPHSIIVALAHSAYTGPATPLVLHGPLHRQDTMGGTIVTLHRTEDYLVSASTLPSPVPQEACNPFPFSAPGTSLYQHHLWEIALGGHARVFTQSPAVFDEILDARPGYWVGERSAPTLAQVGSTVLAIYRLDPQALVPFTHAWWPTPAFDEEVLDGSWAFGRKGDAYVALWCSVPPRRASKVAQQAELRAYGPDHAWVAMAGSRREHGSWADFQAHSRRRAPHYDPSTGRLSLTAGPTLVAGEGLVGAPAAPRPGAAPALDAH